jgi:hypothetical protein
MAVVALMFATVVSLSSAKSASAHTVCQPWYYDQYGQLQYYCYYDNSDEIAALQAALYATNTASYGNYGQLLGDYAPPVVVNWQGYFPEGTFYH